MRQDSGAGEDRVKTRRYFLTMYALFGVMCLLAAGSVFATDVKVTCVGPTTYTDGTSLGSSSITYTLYGAKQGVTKQKLTTGSVCDFTRTNVSTGVQEYYVTATVAGAPESGPSPTGSVTIAQPAPNAPTGTTVVTITIVTPQP